MATATLSSKGQVTIPKVIRDKFHLEIGDKIEFMEDAQGVVTILPACENVTKLKGMIRKPAMPVSIESMKQAIEKEGGSK